MAVRSMLSSLARKQTPAERVYDLRAKPLSFSAFEVWVPRLLQLMFLLATIFAAAGFGG